MGKNVQHFNFIASVFVVRQNPNYTIEYILRYVWGPGECVCPTTAPKH